MPSRRRRERSRVHRAGCIAPGAAQEDHGAGRRHDGRDPRHPVRERRVVQREQPRPRDPGRDLVAQRDAEGHAEKDHRRRRRPSVRARAPGRATIRLRARATPLRVRTLRRRPDRVRRHPAVRRGPLTRRRRPASAAPGRRATAARCALACARTRCVRWSPCGPNAMNSDVGVEKNWASRSRRRVAAASTASSRCAGKWRSIFRACTASAAHVPSRV